MKPPTINLPQMPNAPPPPPVFGMAPSGGKPSRKSQAPSFLGAADVPTAGQTGMKTLTGQ